MTPYEWITDRRHVAALWILFIAMIITGAALDQLRPPDGWIALEFPALADPSTIMPDAWTQEQRETVLFGLGLDFLFLMIYPLFLSLLCVRAARRWDLPGRLAKISMTLGTLVLLAVPLDALENIGLYYLIMGETGEPLRWFITVVSAPKWIVSLAAALVGLACLTVRVLPPIR